MILNAGVSKSFRTGRLERELQMVQLSATTCSCISILWVSIVSFAAIRLSVASQVVLFVVFCCYCLIRYWLSPETFGYTLVIWYGRCLASNTFMFSNIWVAMGHLRYYLLSFIIFFLNYSATLFCSEDLIDENLRIQLHTSAFTSFSYD
jgi:hypothetical protein